MSYPSILDIAAEVRGGRRSAVSLAKEAIARIRAEDGQYLAVTRLLAERALAEAAAVDTKVGAGEDPGPLAGVPYGGKDRVGKPGVNQMQDRPHARA